MKVMIVGATSCLAAEAAKHFAQEGSDIFLVGRNPEKLSAVRQDLAVRGAGSVQIHQADLAAPQPREDIVSAALKSMGELDAVLIAYGSLGSQSACESDPARAIEEVELNLVSVIAVLTPLVNYFEGRKQGCLAVITSVAGDRGRQSNYVYGTSKGALSIFLQGVRHRLCETKLRAIDLKLGPVDTPMTASLQKNRLFITPARAGRAIFTAMKKRRGVVYIPWFWRPVMLLLRAVPEFLFHRTNL